MCKIYSTALNLLLAVAALNAQNYCNPELCSGSQHIACNHNGSFAAGCNGRMISLNNHITLILQLHNQYRNQLASGHISRFPTARRMGTMRWHQELAHLAAYNVLQCNMAHDQCRNTQRFRYAGQNLSLLTSRTPDIAAFLRQHIAYWWQEHRWAQPSNMQNLSRLSEGGREIGHFTVMANERNTFVGCALAQFSLSTGTTGTLLACNYAVTNIYNNPVYRAGNIAAECHTGRNHNFTSLCSIREIYDFNQWRY